MSDTANFYINADSSGFDSAVSALNRLEQAADSVERKLASLEQHLLDVANAAKVAGNTHIGNMTTLGHAVNARFDNDPNNLPPDVQQAHQAYTQAQQQADHADQRQTQQSANQKAKQGASSADGADGGDAASQHVKGQAKDQSDRSFLMRLAETIGRTRTANSLGAFATGNSGPLVNTMAQALTRTLIDSKSLSGLYGSTISRVQTGAFRALAGGAAADLEAGGIPALSAMGGEGVMAGGAAAGAIGSLGTLVPIIVAAVAAYSIVKLANDVNGVYARQVTEQQGLAANLGGGITDRNKLRQQLLDIGLNGYQYSEQQTFALANQLGRSGVQTSQLNGAMSVSMAAARMTGLDPGVTGGLTATMMVSGGKSVDQVAAAFMNMRDAAEKSHVSMNTMIDSLTALEQATGGASINVASLSALQAQLGPSVNAGTLVSPMAGATGVNALVDAALLHKPLSQFIQQQGQPNALMGGVSGLAKQMFGGRNTPQNQELFLQMFGKSGLGMLDFSGMNPGQQLSLASSAISGDMSGYQKKLKQFTAQETPNKESSKTFLQRESDLAGQETTLAKQAENKVNTVSQSFVGAVGTQITSFNALTGVVNDVKHALEGLGKFVHDSLSLGQDDNPTPPGSGAIGSLNFKGGGIQMPNGYGSGTSFASNAEINTLTAAAKKYGVPPALMLAIAGHESRFGTDPRMGAAGVGQITDPALRQEIATKGSPLYGMTYAKAAAERADPTKNAAMQAWYLKYLEQNHPGATDQQIAAMYNSGSDAQGYGAAVAKSEHQIEIILKNERGQELARKKTTLTTHGSHDPKRPPRGQSRQRAQQPSPQPHHPHVN